MKILAIGHKSRQGKDALANFLVSYLRMNGKNTIKIGWADVLKEVCWRCYAWAGVKPMEYYENNPKERDTILPALGKNVVQLWIDFGNHARDYDPNIWINAGFGAGKAEVVIFKDTRFHNECAAVKARGGVLLKVEKPGTPGLDSVSDNALNDFTGWDEVISNDKDLRELNRKAVLIGDKYVLNAR